MKKILVLCTGNSCRSQMAQGYLQKFAGSRAEIYSAGVVAHGLNPRTVEVMAEDDVDISHHTSDKAETYTGEKFDFIITVCDHAKENCPYFPGEAVRLHHNFADPADATGSQEDILITYRKVRDEIKIFSKQFVEERL